MVTDVVDIDSCHGRTIFATRQQAVEGTKMPIVNFVYQCMNDSCRHTEKSAGIKNVQIDCPKCGSGMRLIGMERKDEPNRK